MQELSMHILDIVQNSITANATLIEIEIQENPTTDTLIIAIKDNGKGMSDEFVRNAVDPFSTTRTTRKVGLGISLFKAAAEGCDGNLTLWSKPGVGTTLTVNFKRSHIDRAPIGNMADTMASLILCNPSLDFIYKHSINTAEFVFDTTEIKKVLDGADISDLSIIEWIKQYISEGLDTLQE